jgi:hypothetical protein
MGKGGGGAEDYSELIQVYKKFNKHEVTAY